MTSRLYQKYYGNFFPSASQKIMDLLRRNLSKSMRILEIGFGSGHLMFTLLEEGYSVSGIEVREDAFNGTKEKMQAAGFQTELYNLDFMELHEQYDCIYTTGLLQCLHGNQRLDMIEAISKRCHKAIIVVPKIMADRNLDSDQLTGVAGSPEYKTGNLAMELYHSFPYVREGEWSKESLELSDAFSYYICVNLDKDS